jgi:hypothetical protein
VGVGDPLEAPYRLTAPIPQGRWKLVGDGIILAPCDVQFDVLWRRTSGDTTVASFSHHFEVPPPPDQFNAVAFDGEADGIAAPAVTGDHLVLRFSVTSSHPAGTKQYIPNGDGGDALGRIPSLILPAN